MTQTDSASAQKERLHPPERLDAFADGMFAIASTLLVLEIAPPELRNGSLIQGLAHEWPAFLAYVISLFTLRDGVDGALRRDAVAAGRERRARRQPTDRSAADAGEQMPMHACQHAGPDHPLTAWTQVRSVPPLQRGLRFAA